MEKLLDEFFEKRSESVRILSDGDLEEAELYQSYTHNNEPVLEADNHGYPKVEVYDFGKRFLVKFESMDEELYYDILPEISEDFEEFLEKNLRNVNPILNSDYIPDHHE